MTLKATKENKGSLPSNSDLVQHKLFFLKIEHRLTSEP